jgi:hypothetical protein
MNKINNLNNNPITSNLNLSFLNSEELISIKYNKNYPKISLNKNEESELLSNLDSNNFKTSLNQLNEYSQNIKLYSSKNINQIINSKETVIVKTLDTEINNENSSNISRSNKGVINMLIPVKYSHSAANAASATAAKLSNRYGQSKLLFKNMDIKVTNLLNKISKFNSEIAQSQYIQYNYNNTKKIFMESIISILMNSFYEMKSIISTPVFYITPNTVVIHLLYYVHRKRSNFRNKSFLSLKGTRQNKKNSKFSSRSAQEASTPKFLKLHTNKLELLCYILSQCFNKKVVLDLVRIHNPYNDSKILAETFGLLSQNVRVKIRSLADKTFKHAKIKNSTFNKKRISIIPSFITGIKIKLGGRIASLKTAPRFSVFKYQQGTLARCKANFLTTSRSTYKCKRGSFSYTVSIGQSFF